MRRRDTKRKRASESCERPTGWNQERRLLTQKKRFGYSACGGVVLRTARELDVSRSGLMSRMTTLDIDAEKFKAKRG